MAIADNIKNEVVNMDRARMFVDLLFGRLAGFYRMASKLSKGEELEAALEIADTIEELREVVYSESMSTLIAHALDESRYYQEQMH